MDEFDIRAVAEQIRTELAELLGAEAVSVAVELDAALERSRRGEDVGDRLMAILAARPATRARMDQLLPAPPEDGERGFEPMPGLSAEPVGFAVYTCPACDYEFPVFDAGEPIPDCPVHGLALVPGDES